MTAPAAQRVRHRRRATGRRAVIGSVAALAPTGGALVATSLLSGAGAAPTWPTARGSRAMAMALTRTIEASGTFDGKLRKFLGRGALGDAGQDEGPEPTRIGTGVDGTTSKFSPSGITYK
ncbi:hypothetical protein [Streptomyces europaeiscabiei]|uniref:hypothetical protein n=1 Tax=Streptomyces europaeiscabiei TaxID=146819 RepID=UPI0029BE3883|nr:hypothetical protein [Streptomyces europaeiscabiei]MDX3616975.1 hypothetical protein [Streptomyces europaeiscabiei]MDX3635309.1 hypothetical protein [Streptomyces europaeiscabiei]MDX3653579.1 hypothetical protein [Streptomyces europaeiscabiei]